MLEDIFQSLADPQQKHAMMIHLPIAVSLLGVFGLAAMMITRGRSRALRWCCVGLYVLGGLAAWTAAEAGEEAMDRLDPAVMTQEALEHLEKHEEMGERVWLFLMLTGAIAAVSASRRNRVRTASLALALLAGFGTAAYTGVTSHHGGAMVYRHGVGVPTSPNNLNADSPINANHLPPAHTEDEHE